MLNIGGKVREKLLNNKINYHLYKNKLMTNKQYGFTPQKILQTQLWRKKVNRNGTGEKRGGNNDQPRC